MTNYGTIPTSSAPGSCSMNHDSKEWIRRPWKLMFDYHKFNFPSSFSESIHRLKTSIPYFLRNYALIVLGILFVSQNCHSISQVVFLITMSALVMLYTMRDVRVPLVIFNRTISYPLLLTVLTILTGGLMLFARATVNILMPMLVSGNRAVFIMLTILNVALLFFTGATLNILISLLVGVVVAALHAALRKTEDLYIDEESASLLHSGVSDSS